MALHPANDARTRTRQNTLPIIPHPLFWPRDHCVRLLIGGILPAVRNERQRTIAGAVREGCEPTLQAAWSRGLGGRAIPGDTADDCPCCGPPADSPHQLNKTRAPVEHAFARLEQLGGTGVRTMTLARNELAITLKCVAYNAKRLVWLMAQGATA